MKCSWSALGVLILTSLNARHAESANILFFFGVSTYSHRIVAWPLVEALVERNHSVTFFQPDKNKNPHEKVIEINPVVDGISKQYNFMKRRFQLGPQRLLLDLTYKLPEIGLNMCVSFLEDPNIVNWIKNSKFDLIVVDALFNECAYGIAHLHKAKVILFGTSHPFGWFPDTLGFPSETYAFPEIHLGLDLPLSFVNRVLATTSVLYFNIIRHLSFPKLENVLRKGLDIPDMPSIPDLMANTSLVFTNTHFSEELSRSHPPNLVSIGGMTCRDRSLLKPISKDILDFINGGGDDGFILVSFGSGARILDAPEETQEMFFNVFERLKLRVLWKWEGARPERMPKNIMTTKWIPLQEVLAHPKIRIFIMHGGLVSMHEAIFHQVPMISFPIFAEQDFNAERLHRTKRGIRLEITTLSEDQLEDAIQKILTDDTYKNNVVEASKRFMDRPHTPLETSVWWTEYVLRQEDTGFMRPLGADLTWFQQRLMDVWAFFALLIVVFIYIIIKIVKYAIRSLLATAGGSGKGKVKVH